MSKTTIKTPYEDIMNKVNKCQHQAWELLLEQCQKDPEFINHTTPTNSRTFLMIALGSGNYEVAQKILGLHNVNVYARDTWGWGASTFAIKRISDQEEWGSKQMLWECIRGLLEKGCIMDCEEDRRYLSFLPQEDQHHFQALKESIGLNNHLQKQDVNSPKTPTKQKL